ncbi:DUF4168 domain-containing protein [Meridianimarinicoccus sp. RP-17]|uniref:DUF4168 domain-containing protein n=1 Tax=Meridianimarinicoccus zhengii TaxID=2056810 RepID=UPI000DAB8758|nr:DUF4168 domain-containing protein [Phycocomes zhengii]
MTDIPMAKTFLAAFGLAVFGGALPMVALANDATFGSAPLVLAQAPSFDEDKIEAFAMAEAKIQKIRSAYAPELETAESKLEQIEIRRQAGTEMVTAVSQTPGITLEEYNAIVDTAAADPVLAARVDEALAERTE